MRGVFACVSFKNTSSVTATQIRFDFPLLDGRKDVVGTAHLDAKGTFRIERIDYADGKNANKKTSAYKNRFTRPTSAGLGASPMRRHLERGGPDLADLPTGTRGVPVLFALCG